ncbi:hypothetical protein ACFVYD_16490, partial [Streptomyces sp. NPDC058301]|uniref:hypothetical protein n=1 Tax=Streptomyces sp. NPDC058301 TaxID=3346436 RepID=UPI0036E2A6BF
MGTLPRSASRWPRRFVLSATALAAIGLAVSPAGATPSGAATPAASTQVALHKAPENLYLFQYTYRGHLKNLGGHFTLVGKVYVADKNNSGQVRYK